MAMNDNRLLLRKLRAIRIRVYRKSPLLNFDIGVLIVTSSLIIYTHKWNTRRTFFFKLKWRESLSADNKYQYMIPYCLNTSSVQYKIDFIENPPYKILILEVLKITVSFEVAYTHKWNNRRPFFLHT